MAEQDEGRPEHPSLLPQEFDRYVRVGSRHLTFSEDTPFRVWEAVVRVLKHYERSIQFWLGDALAFGERRYGETYSQALEETDYTYGGLANMAYVSRKVEVSSRDETLSWSHHRAVAPLEPHEQRALLGKAREEGWSVSRLREEADGRKILPAPPPDDAPPPEPPTGQPPPVEDGPTENALVCPHCGGLVLSVGQW